MILVVIFSALALSCGSPGSGCSDDDGDGYGTGDGCRGPDCNDDDPSCHAGDCCAGPVCTDADNDGYGDHCDPGPDCNDDDPTCWQGECCQTPVAELEIYLLDIWAQPLPEGRTTFSIAHAGASVDHTGYPVIEVPLHDPGSYDISVSSEEHEPLSFGVIWDGTDEPGGLALSAGAGTEGHGLSLSHHSRSTGDSMVTVHTVYVGLRHKWFSAQGRPARRGNNVTLFINGEEAWAAVYSDLAEASLAVNIASWWWMSDFELVRPWDTHPYLTEEQRWANTIMGVLETSPAHIRILVGEFWGSHDVLDFLTSDDLLRSFAETAGDGFEFLGVGNETSGKFEWALTPFLFADRVRENFPETSGRSFVPEEQIRSRIPPYQVDMTDWPLMEVEFQIASWHQKFMTIDHEVAFIGGMNVKSTDWDSRQHLVFDHRRMNYDASTGDREAVMAKERESDLGPRRDYMLRVEGPTVQDAAEVFRRRWSQAIADGVNYADRCTEFAVERDISARPANRQVQVTTTMPEPFWEHSIAETWFNAIANAEHYIYVEDQYWRIPLLVDAISKRMREVPDLKLIVITKPVDEWLDPGCEWTYRTHQQLLNEFGTSRYRTYQLRTFDYVVTWGIDETESRFLDIDTHSKMLIVDDEFMSVGSCNKNNRGIIYEGELNAAILDAEWVGGQRRQILESILPDDVSVGDDVDVWWRQLEEAAAYNDAVYQRWADEGWDIDNGDGSGPVAEEYLPRGFIYTLSMGDVEDCFLEGVGPDMTFWNPPAFGD